MMVKRTSLEGNDFEIKARFYFATHLKNFGEKP
jgi:hypothetical protein